METMVFSITLRLTKTKIKQELLKKKIVKRFFRPEDMIGLLKSNLRIFLLREFGVVWIYIDLPGIVIWQHIHPSTLHSYLEEG